MMENREGAARLSETERLTQIEPRINWGKFNNVTQRVVGGMLEELTVSTIDSDPVHTHGLYEQVVDSLIYVSSSLHTELNGRLATRTVAEELRECAQEAGYHEDSELITQLSSMQSVLSALARPRQRRVSQ